MTTLSDWLRAQVTQPSIVKHRDNQKNVVLWSRYDAIAQNLHESLVIGAFHLDYIGFQRLAQPTTIKALETALIQFYNAKIIKTATGRLTNDGWLINSKPTPQNIKAVLCQKTPQQLAIAEQTCQWCKCSTIATQEHHYPIPKSQGGLETVKICANCHFEFHQLLEASVYTVSPKLVAFFETEMEG